MNKALKLSSLLAIWFLVQIGFSHNLTAQEAEKPKKVKKRKEVTEGRITETELRRITEADSIWDLSFYGFVKADYIYATDAVLSYGRENLQAANQAKRQVQRGDYQNRHNIQLQDSRIGFKSKYKDKITGIIEMDFINFDQSSPNVNVRPRLRQAYIEWQITNSFQLFAGQKWDIFSPLNPDTYNIINNLFYLGNAGWMREEFGVAYKPIRDITISAAIGNTAVNTAASPNVGIERSPSPTFAGQVKWTPTKEHTVYLSGITVNRSYRNPNSDPSMAEGLPLFYDGSPESFAMASELGKSGKISRQATGLSIGSEYKPESGKFRFKWEGNWGRNMSDLNTLGIGQAQITTLGARNQFSNNGIYTQSGRNGVLNPANENGLVSYQSGINEVVTIEELGGWISMAYKFDPSWEFGLNLGVTKIMNPKDLMPATDSSQADGLLDFSLSQPTPDSGVWGANQLGRLRESGTIGYNFTFFAESSLRLFFQHEYIQSFYQDAQRDRGVLAHIDSVDLDTGRITLREVMQPHLKASGRATVHMLRVGTIYNF